MEKERQFRLFIWGGICGIIGTSLYVIAIVAPMPNIMAYALVMAWPLLSIIFVYSLYKFIAFVDQNVFNQLAFLMACLAFTILSIMISSQLAVKFGVEEYIAASKSDEEILFVIRKALRLIDMGIDVAWDLFIGVSLLFLSGAMKTNKFFSRWWSLLAALLGITLIILNVVTFPWPPDTRGLFDVGPFIGLYIIALSIRLLIIGLRMRDLPISMDNNDLQKNKK